MAEQRKGVDRSRQAPVRHRKVVAVGSWREFGRAVGAFSLAVAVMIPALALLLAIELVLERRHDDFMSTANMVHGVVRTVDDGGDDGPDRVTIAYSSHDEAQTVIVEMPDTDYVVGDRVELGVDEDDSSDAHLVGDTGGFATPWWLWVPLIPVGIVGTLAFVYSLDLIGPIFREGWALVRRPWSASSAIAPRTAAASTDESVAAAAPLWGSGEDTSA